MKIKISNISSIFLLLFLSIEVHATLLDDIDFTDLKLELGTALPDGSSVTVTQAEAPDDTTTPSWVPDISSGQFTSKIFNDRTPGSDGISSHATSVAMRFYGSTVSAVSAVGSIDLFEAGNWVGNGFLNTGAGGPIANSIDVSTTRLINHSWEADWTTWNPEILRRIDFLVEVDDYIQVVGMGTNSITNPVPTNSFNAIVLGITNETIVTGTAAIDATYTSGRAKPDVVMPETTGSASAAWTSSASVLLIDYAHENPLLSNGSTTNRNSDTIYNAERSETIKAIIMAGADRETSGTTNTGNADITDYRADGKQTTNGLDTRFGAGQLNIYNSYHILDGGEQDSTEDSGTNISNMGFDYDASFGGLNSSNSVATYNFATSAAIGQKLKASLVWNIEVTSKTSDNFYDLDLQLIDVTGGSSVIASSTSTIDNTENLWENLQSNRSYQLKVIAGSTQSDFEWDYALAWQVVVPGISVLETNSSTATIEDGTSDTFTLVLDSPPAGDVTINLISSDTNEATLSPSSLTFTSTDWRTPQTVTVTGVDDVIDDGDKNYNIDFTVSSVADSNYDGLVITSITAINTDNEATFSFTDQTDVALNTLITSNTTTVTGLLNPAVISISAGEYSINSNAYTSVAGTISNNDTVSVRINSSTTGLTVVDTVLTIGDINELFTVTTELDTDGDGIGNSTDTDDDNDGLIDTDELTLGTDPLVADTDNDGLTDSEEVILTTNPLIIDTDNDGFSDGEEVSAGSDPLDINSLPVLSDADINNNGIADMADIILAQQIILGHIELTSIHLSHGDVAPLINGIPSPDGLFTLGDLVVLKRKVIDEITF